MRAARRMKDDMAGKSQFRRQYRPADRRRRPFEEPRKQGILECPDLIPVADGRLHAAFGVCVLQRLDVAAIMEFEQLIERCRRARAKVLVIQPPENSGKIRDSGMAHDTQRVVAAECGTAKDLAANEQRRW